MDTVLGLSMTSTTVGFVLVEGQGADGATMDHDAFNVDTANAAATSKQVTAAVLRTRASAAARGNRLHSIGVTWSDDADTQASLLLEALSDSGFDNVVAVRLPEASEALAWGLGPVIGYEKTAVCVIEPETVIASVVDTRDGAALTEVSHIRGSDDDLVQWLTEVFDQHDWQPEGLVVVGSGDDRDAITAQLEDALSLPVFAPPEAPLALARGAALASAQSNEFGFADLDEDPSDLGGDDATTARPRLLSHGAALSLLVAGVLTFVVSLSLAVSLQFVPDHDAPPAEQRDVANTSGTPPVVRAVPPPIIPVVAPPVLPPAPEVEQPVEALIPEAPPEILEVSAPELYVPEQAPAGVPAVAPAAPAPFVPPPAVVPPPAAVPPVAEEKPGILRRVLGKVPGFRNKYGQEEQAPVQQFPPPPPPP